MARNRLQRMQELLTHLGHFSHGQLLTREVLIRQLQTAVSDVDTGMCVDAINRAVEFKILGSAGGHFIVRRTALPEDFSKLSATMGIPPVEPPQPVGGDVENTARLIVALPAMEQRLSQLQAQVDAMNASARKPVETPLHHWLTLDFATMPKALRDFLEAQVEGDPTDAHRQMTVFAARVLARTCRVLGHES